MRWIQKLLRHIVYLNIIVALSTATLSGGFCYYLQIPNWLNYGFLALFSTLAVYNGQRLFKSRSTFKTPWLKWVDNNKLPLYFLVILFAIIAVAFMLIIGFQSREAFVLLSGSVLISMFYVIPFGRKSLREISHLKIHLIAISWSAVLIVFPMLNTSVFEHVFWFGLAHYFYIVAVSIPFDIRDLKYDASSQKTIPQVVGVTWSKAIALVLILLFVAMMLYVDEHFLLNPLFFVAVAIQVTLILLMTEKKSDIYTAGWIDAAIAVLGVSYFL